MRLGERHLRVGPMDEQQIDPGQLQLLQAVIERALEIGGRELVLIDLRGHEHVLAPQAGGAQALMQPLPDLGLVAVALGGVDVAIAEAQCRLHGFDADRVLERHGAKADGRNSRAIGFDDMHLRAPSTTPDGRRRSTENRRRTADQQHYC